MDQSPIGCFNLSLSSQDAFAMADLGFERLNRKPNFSAKETQFIIDMVRKYKFVLNEKALDSATNERKREVWQLICDGINEMTPGVSRSVDEIRKRWQNLNCTARKEASKFKKYQTEGLPPPPLSNFSMQILGMDSQEDLGQDSDVGNPVMKIEIDLASEDNDDNSIQDIPVFPGIPGSPVQPSGDSSKCDNLSLSSVPDHVYLTTVSTPTSNNPGDDLHHLGSSEASNNSATKQEVSSQSPFALSIQQPKFTSNGSLPRTDHDASSSVAANKSKGSSLTSSKSSGITSNQGTVTQMKSFKSKPFNMTGDAQIMNDNLAYSSMTTFTTSTNNKTGCATKQESAKRRRLDDLSLQLHEELLTGEREAVSLEREKLKIEKEKLKMEQEQLTVEMQKVLMEKERLNLEKDVEREKLRMERERFSMEMQQERQKLALERERLELAREQERSRSRLEQEKMDIEKEKMAMEQEKLALEISYWRRKLLQTRSSHDDSGLNVTN